jgi:hypothetical protein
MIDRVPSICGVFCDQRATVVDVDDHDGHVEDEFY